MLLALQAISLLAQDKEGDLFIGTSMLFESDTPRTFLILGIDQDQYQDRFLEVVGKPASSTTGVMSWHNVAIAGLPVHIHVRLTDGIMTHDKVNKTACFVPFTDQEDKKKKLAQIQPNQERHMEISILDNKDRNIIRSPQTEDISKAFLYNAYARK